MQWEDLCKMVVKETGERRERRDGRDKRTSEAKEEAPTGSGRGGEGRVGASGRKRSGRSEWATAARGEQLSCLSKEKSPPKTELEKKEDDYLEVRLVELLTCSLPSFASWHICTG